MNDASICERRFLLLQKAELIKKGEEITKRLNEKYKPILLARRVQKDANK